MAIDYRGTRLAHDRMTQQNRVLIEQGRATALTRENITVMTQIIDYHD